MDPWNVLFVLFALFAGAATLLAVGIGVAGYLVASELRLFLRAPAYYVQKLLGPPGHTARARTVYVSGGFIVRFLSGCRTKKLGKVN